MSSNTVERDVQSGIPTGVASDDALASERALRSESWKEGWNRIIDQYLFEWGPSRFDADEIVPPSRFIVHCAIDVALWLRDAGWPPPLRVVPDGDGGIAFERRDGDAFECLEIASDGHVELVTFHDVKLVRRLQLPHVSRWM